MRLSYQWLKEFVELDLTPQQLSDKLTLAGLEVEEIERFGEGLDAVEVVEAIDLQPHPNAKKLRLATVRRSGDRTETVVCGAPNVEVGGKYPLAPVGTKLPSMEIREAEIRGVKSRGMLCSEVELGLSEESTGLMELPADWALGPIYDAFDLRDTVLEISLTPNRGDCLSVLGLAREVSAMTGAGLRMPTALPHRSHDGPALEGWVGVDLQDPNGCPRYTARTMEVRVAPSPFWMKYRLKLGGIRPINNVVDVTNYVLLELGQPMHAFDQSKLAGQRLVIRRAKAGEKILALDEKEYALDENDLIIADADRPVAIAGVMGGEESSVFADTQRLVLESAQFDPTRVRKTAKRLNLHSESSHRFERGVDPIGVATGSDRAAYLYTQVAEGKDDPRLIDCWPEGHSPIELTVRPQRTRIRMGADIKTQRMADDLQSLGFAIRSQSEEKIEVVSPPWRNDIEREIDLVEEIGRMYGYDNIPSELPPNPMGFKHEFRSGGTGEESISDRLPQLRDQTASYLALCGFFEAINHSFAAPGEEDWTGWGPAVPIANPMAPEQGVMRRSLLGGLLRNIQTNLFRQNEDVRLYELASIHRESPNADRPCEDRWRLGLAACGRRLERFWKDEKILFDFYDLKAVVVDWFNLMGMPEPKFESAQHPLMHPGKTARILCEGEELGWIGELHPAQMRQSDIPVPVQLAEIDLQSILKASWREEGKFSPLPKQPATERDLALVVDSVVSADSMLGAVKELRSDGLEILEDVWIFDQYEGKPIPEGKKSVGIRLRLRDRERTLTESDISSASDRCLGRLRDRFSAEFRGA